MTLEPAVILRLMGIKVIENDVDGRIRASGNDAVHELEKIHAPPPILMSGHHLAGGHLEGGEQGRGAMALVVMAMAGQRSAVRELEIALARSRAWIEGFSSTQRTIAFSGGAM